MDVSIMIHEISQMSSQVEKSTNVKYVRVVKAAINFAEIPNDVGSGVQRYGVLIRVLMPSPCQPAHGRTFSLNLQADLDWRREAPGC